jgi:hypothetical protein
MASSGLCHFHRCVRRMRDERTGGDSLGCGGNYLCYPWLALASRVGRGRIGGCAAEVNEEKTLTIWA